jgi:hyperosmotically inducible protein
MIYKSLSKPMFSIILFMSLLAVSCKPSDASIAESAKEKVAAISPSVTVEAKDGVVTLGGEVADEATKAAAESALAGLKGVKSVVNNITVPPPPPPPVQINPDDVLRQTVDSVFAAKGIKGVTATVSAGVVTLTGSVKKADRIKAMQAVNEAKPKQVVNEIKDIK